MRVHSRRSVPPLEVALGQAHIEQVRTFKFLGCIINEHLTWDDHIVHVSAKVTQNINLLRQLSWFLPKHALITFYNAYILPSFDCCDVVWQNYLQKATAKLERLQNYTGRVIPKELRVISPSWVREQFGWKTLQTAATAACSYSGLQKPEWLGSRLLGTTPDSDLQCPLPQH